MLVVKFSHELETDSTSILNQRLIFVHVKWCGVPNERKTSMMAHLWVCYK